MISLLKIRNCADSISERDDLFFGSYRRLGRSTLQLFLLFFCYFILSFRNIFLFTLIRTLPLTFIARYCNFVSFVSS